jgi:hypothetical protein
VDEAVRDHLEGDVTIESRITRLVHLAHPAGPDGGDDQRFAVIIWAGRQCGRDYSRVTVLCLSTKRTGVGGMPTLRR